jgi:hypothetical protein
VDGGVYVGNFGKDRNVDCWTGRLPEGVLPEAARAFLQKCALFRLDVLCARYGEGP